MYSILKLCIQNYLPNTIKYENKFFFFFLYLDLRFEYKILEMKSGYTLFETKKAKHFKSFVLVFVLNLDKI